MTVFRSVVCNMKSSGVTSNLSQQTLRWQEPTLYHDLTMRGLLDDDGDSLVGRLHMYNLPRSSLMI
jgi:hypothetical protein